MKQKYSFIFVYLLSFARFLAGSPAQHCVAPLRVPVTVLGDFTIVKLAEFVFQANALAQLSYYDVNMQKCYID